MKLNPQIISEVLKQKKISDYSIDIANVTNFQNHLQKYKEAVELKLNSGVTSDLEEHCKKLFNDFFKDVYCYDVNTHARIDSVIRDTDNNIKVMIEVKSPNNDKEMINDDSVNNKALHELLLYYYEQREAIVSTINNLIITDCKTVYFFNSGEFENIINNKKIKKLLSAYKNKELEIIKTTTDFYKEVSKLLDLESIEISAIKINLFDEEMNFEHVYRLFDKHSLLNKALENDANKLNRKFYQELLHIMGLQEKENKLVKSNVKNTLLDLTEQKINKKDSFETALGLNILWLNRILFLKILESQLKVFRNDADFHILDSKHITGYHLLSKLFFDILSTPRSQRHEDDIKKYDDIPYLNSSLFEETELERQYRISDLDIERMLKIKADSILYEDEIFKAKNISKLTLLEYMLRFLNCFSYNSDSDSVDKNTLIKSSVLGTVFERLNGYKDGSHFTPASITMYMSEKVLQKRIIDIFNKEFALEFEDFTELSTHVFRNYSTGAERQKAQALVDNITILDPAVGSGHFLVSSLNELIKIKSQLGLLYDDIKVTIDNDELIIKSSFGRAFVYNLEENAISAEKQEIQKAIFNTKKHIIENQLYGVDINPNSVNICRLRLWIELLKHTYYTDDKYTDLEVLPNLEFKIMTANSLLGLKKSNEGLVSTDYEPLKNKLKDKFREYFEAVKNKQEIKESITQILDELKGMTTFDDESDQVRQLADFSPFNTTVSAPFFDSEFMFGIDDFDIVIGNPPYVGNKDIPQAMMNEYKQEYGEADDLYNYFYHRGFDFLKPNGILGYITSNTFLTIQSKQKLRQFLQSKELLEMRLVDNVFESAAVEPIIVIAKNTELKDYKFNYIDNRFSDDLFSDDNKINISISLFKNAPNQVFFTPTNYNLDIANKYFGTIQKLMTAYWNAIRTSANIDKNQNLLNSYKATLKAGDVTLLGLITDGGQGLATANNGFYIGVRESNKDSERTYKQRIEKIEKFNKEYKTDYDITKMTELEIRALFLALKTKHGRDIFGQGFLYQIISDEEIADVNTLTQDEKDNGIDGKRSFVPYDKGDKGGNRWYMPTSYCINWSIENVTFLKSNSGKKGQGMPVVRNPQFYFKEGFSWNNVLNPNAILIKTRSKEVSINDVASMSLYNMSTHTTNKYLIVLLNSYFIFYYLRLFINNTVNLQINDMRQLPIIIPTPKQLEQAEQLFDRAKAIKDQQIQTLITKDIADEQLATLQNEVDDFVYGLYGLDREDIDLVKGN